MNNRDMFYQNLNQGYQAPGMIYPPSGYNLNQEYQAYGPNVIPPNYNNQINNHLLYLYILNFYLSIFLV